MYVQYNTKAFHPLNILLQVSNMCKICVGELYTFCDSTSGVCAGMCPLMWMTCMYVYVHSLCMQEDHMHLWRCLVESAIKKSTSPPTGMDGACFSG